MYSIKKIPFYSGLFQTWELGFPAKRRKCKNKIKLEPLNRHYWKKLLILTQKSSYMGSEEDF